jgi:hypothetical protein
MLGNLSLQPSGKLAVRGGQLRQKVVVVCGQFVKPVAIEQKQA